jgi:hypothetical protein
MAEVLFFTGNGSEPAALVVSSFAVCRGTIALAVRLCTEQNQVDDPEPRNVMPRLGGVLLSKEAAEQLRDALDRWLSGSVGPDAKIDSIGTL